MELEDIIEKIDSFLDKQGLALESKEKVTRLMAERYWEDIKLEDEGEEIEDEVDDGVDAPEEPEEKVEEPKGDEKVEPKQDKKTKDEKDSKEKKKGDF